MISLLGIYSAIFQGLNKPGIPSMIIVITAALNIIFSYFLTKNYGIIGAGLSNAITCTIALIISVILFEIKWKKYSKI
jgi:O-antigen/teichoic acid export membrane protein